MVGMLPNSRRKHAILRDRRRPLDDQSFFAPLTGWDLWVCHRYAEARQVMRLVTTPGAAEALRERQAAIRALVDLMTDGTEAPADR